MSTAETSARVPSSREVESADKGLKSGAIGFLSNLVIGTASVAPAYSLAATRWASSLPSRGSASTHRG